MKRKKTMVNEVIDGMGGTVAAASWLGVHPSVVSNWRRAGQFPDRVSLMIKLREECRIRGLPLEERLFIK